MKNVINRAGYAVLVLLLLSISSVANAHKFRLSVYVEGNLVEGEVYYVGGGSPPGAGAGIELIKQGVVVQSAIADEEGLFSFGEIAPDTYTVRADGGQGHVALYELEATEFLPQEAIADNEPSQQESSPSNSLTQQELQKAIAQAIRPLREQIDRYEAKTRLHDILGGIGYIFGLFGVLVMVRNRKLLSRQ
ncbi:hypothetical protein BIY22_05495 [Vibrio panuliri]|uniref:Cobalt ABC transporter permease n=1 Tax=Vibrio panuliri TaxID=1381081 RepID=A0A1Q9HJG4_9VIBR|nr:hypothetical protein [Vibrio panuliri]OLQ90447.1 hypothetical protein BIY22_05495 [Vibrio panuliri]